MRQYRSFEPSSPAPTPGAAELPSHQVILQALAHRPAARAADVGMTANDQHPYDVIAVGIKEHDVPTQMAFADPDERTVQGMIPHFVRQGPRRDLAFCLVEYADLVGDHRVVREQRTIGISEKGRRLYSDDRARFSA